MGPYRARRPGRDQNDLLPFLGRLEPDGQTEGSHTPAPAASLPPPRLRVWPLSPLPEMPEALADPHPQGSAPALVTNQQPVQPGPQPHFQQEVLCGDSERYCNADMRATAHRLRAERAGGRGSCTCPCGTPSVTLPASQAGSEHRITSLCSISALPFNLMPLNVVSHSLPRQPCGALPSCPFSEGKLRQGG